MEQRDGRLAVVFSWAERSGKRHEWAQLLRLREGMIVEMEDYANGTRALRACVADGRCCSADPVNTSVTGVG